MRWPSRASRRRTALDVALAALTTIEPDIGRPLPARPRALTARGWEVRADGDDVSALIARLPADERQLTAAKRTPDAPVPATRVVARTGATLVRFAKLSTGGQVRGRAFYLDREPALTVRFTVGGAAELARIEQEVAARRAVARCAQLPAPAIVRAEVGGGVGYLAETVVFGSHAHQPGQKQPLAHVLVTRLLDAGRELGVTDEPFETHRRTMHRLRGLATAAPGVPAHRLDRMLAQAARLLAADELVPVGWCHGDLGFSNVIVDAAGSPTLIDWEHAARKPLAGDLAKVAAMSPDQGAVVRQILAAASPHDVGERPGRRAVADQLALVVLRELSWWEGRRAAAERSGRLAPFERGVRRRLALLDLLDP